MFGPVEAFELDFGPIGPPMMTVFMYVADGVAIDTGQRHVAEWLSGRHLSHVLLTHHHEDHSGNAAMIRRLHGTVVMGHRFIAEKMRTGFDILPYQHIVWGRAGQTEVVPLPPLIDTGRLRFRPVLGKIKTVTVRRASTGKWFVCFSCDDVPEKTVPETDRAVGIDLGLNSFIADSDGHHADNPRHLRNAERLLRVRLRRLARRKKGSAGRNKARVLVAKAHEKVRDQRNDFLHKTANYYIENYQTVVPEKLKARNMVKNHHLAKSITDAGWYTFSEYLTYKAEGAGREIVKVNPAGTGQECSGCGEIVRKSLAVRVHNCPRCGLIIDRDENAAINTLEPSGCA